MGECSKICSNEDELCDILLDLCYKTNKSKQFVWNVVGDVIVNRLLKLKDNHIKYPALVTQRDGQYDFDYCGKLFRMMEKVLEGNDDNIR